MEMETAWRMEDLGGGVKVAVSDAHTFGTDGFLLSHFAAPTPRERACDLGSGCGIVPLLWMRDGGGPKSAVAVDIQPEAVALMEYSVAASGLAGRLRPMHGDLRELRGMLPLGELDLVTCNPPYKAVDTGLLSHSNSDQIARHETLCTLEEVCAAAKGLLRFGGRLCLCQLPERLVDVVDVMRRQGMEPKRLRTVHGAPGDPPWLILVEGRRGGKPFLRVDPPLYLKENGEISPEMREIYRQFGRI